MEYAPKGTAPEESAWGKMREGKRTNCPEEHHDARETVSLLGSVVGPYPEMLGGFG